MIERCKPEEMRKNLDMVYRFERFGIDFVPIPCKSEEHKQELLAQMQLTLNQIVNEAEKNE